MIKMNGIPKLAKLLKKKREELGLSQLEVAKKIGYDTAQFISNIERCLAGVPLKKLKELKNLYGIKDEEIVDLILEEQEKVIKKYLK